MSAMEEAFGIVLFVVVIVGAIGAILSLVLTGRSYRQLGRGPMSMERPPRAPTADPAREDEIRQMRAALSSLRGEEPAIEDPGLRDEIRDLVRAGNARRAARGLAPLDVEAEVERRLRELGT
jgi:hypothetical protein